MDALLGLLLILGGLGFLALCVYSWIWAISGAVQTGKVVIAEVRETIADERVSRADAEGEMKLGKNFERTTEEEVVSILLSAVDFTNTAISLDKALLANAWRLGLPQAAGSNPWAAVPIAYHFEEALIIRALYTEMEYLTGVVTTILAQLEARGTGRGLQPAKVFQAMSWIALPMARERSRLAGSSGVLSEEKASEIHNTRMQEYAALIRSSASCEEPLPTKSFMLGFPRDHPTGAMICTYADRLCAALNLPEEAQGLSSIMLQIAVSQRRNEILLNCTPRE